MFKCSTFGLFDKNPVQHYMLKTNLRRFPSCYSAAFLLFLYVVDDYFYFVPIQICVFNMLFPSSDVSNGLEIVFSFGQQLVWFGI